MAQGRARRPATIRSGELRGGETGVSGGQRSGGSPLLAGSFARSWGTEAQPPSAPERARDCGVRYPRQPELRRREQPRRAKGDPGPDRVTSDLPGPGERAGYGLVFQSGPPRGPQLSSDENRALALRL